MTVERAAALQAAGVPLDLAGMFAWVAREHPGSSGWTLIVKRLRYHATPEAHVYRADLARWYRGVGADPTEAAAAALAAAIVGEGS